MFHFFYAVTLSLSLHPSRFVVCVPSHIAPRKQPETETEIIRTPKIYKHQKSLNFPPIVTVHYNFDRFQIRGFHRVRAEWIPHSDDDPYHNVPTQTHTKCSRYLIMKVDVGDRPWSASMITFACTHLKLSSFRHSGFRCLFFFLCFFHTFSILFVCVRLCPLVAWQTTCF